MTAHTVVVLVVNVLAWSVIHIGFAWVGTRAPTAWFKPETWLFRTHDFERSGRCYELLFRVRAWKDLLPDGASWFRGGFAKKRLVSADRDYLIRYTVESCRGEVVHWAVFLAAGVFFLWNTIWVGFIMVAYGLIANVPCIVVLRYNRARLRRILRRRAMVDGEVELHGDE